jgi:hypothetical protein
MLMTDTYVPDRQKEDTRRQTPTGTVISSDHTLLAEYLPRPPMLNPWLILKKFLAPIFVMAWLAIPQIAAAAPVFSEDFGTLANGTTITTSNTDFTYVRVGSGGGSITALNPSTLSSGASMILAGPTSTSLNGVGVQTGLGLTSVAELSLKLKFDNASTGTLFIGMGQGTTFTGNSVFSTSDLLFGVQSNAGILQYRTDSGWTNAGFTFASDTNYDLFIAADGANLQISVNGSPLSPISDSTNNQNGDGFRIYAVSGAVNYEMDDIIVQVPEPTGVALGGIGLVALAGIARARRKASYNEV